MSITSLDTLDSSSSWGFKLFRRKGGDFSICAHLSSFAVVFCQIECAWRATACCSCLFQESCTLTLHQQWKQKADSRWTSPNIGETKLEYSRWGKSVAQKVERVFILVNNEITKASKTTEFRNSPSSHVPRMPMGSRFGASAIKLTLIN
ncbi:hypothetical protein Tsp_10315 [Trichinella spiralis]|uniref:hypothetical protein n=1 Tax=Trichinella spiralis TaxID=6334 RepID=UPI0001EFE36C|nr:hypothetical protein Tsp_10315 [Trichinella spiralis]